MQSRSQRYTFYATSIVSIMIVTASWLWLSDVLGFSDGVRYSGLTLSVALFLVAWVYPLKIFSEEGRLIGMHREALQASALFIFTSIGMPMDERWGIELPRWGSMLLFVGVTVLAVVLYKIMLYTLSRRSAEAKHMAEQGAAPNP